MSDHADFAAAVTVREHVLDVGLLAAYANGTFAKVLTMDPLLGGPPHVKANVFLGPPEIKCEGATNLLVLTLPIWGPVLVTLDGTEHLAEVAGELKVTVQPAFGLVPGSSNLQFEPPPGNFLVRSWTASVTSEGTPAAVVSYVVGDAFKDRLQLAIQTAVAIRLFNLPSIDVSFLGPLARLATSVEARVRDGAMLLGLNVDGEKGSIVGDAGSLADFAGGNDVAAVVNTAAMTIMFDDVRTRMATAAEESNATLDRFVVNSAAGYFLVSGTASNQKGTVNFSFRVLPSMFHTRQGAAFRYLRKQVNVYSRTWPALGFHVEGVDVDVDRSWWVIVSEAFFGVLTLGFAALYVEELVSAADHNFSGRIKATNSGAPAARVRRTIPPTGGVSVRIGVDQFEITTAGSYIGISVLATPTPVALLGPTSVPSTYSGDVLRYLIRLPSGVSTDDPALRIHWTLEDRTNNVVLTDLDKSAAGRLRFDFWPATFDGAKDFGVIARLYRRLGPNVTEIGTESVNVHIRDPLPPAAYIRWRSQVKNPQVAVDEATDTWVYHGEREVHRWSEWHRTDVPCRAVNAPNRYRVTDETVDRLPFPLRLLENHRKGLCPYCFFGGPAGVNAAL